MAHRNPHSSYSGDDYPDRSDDWRSDEPSDEQIRFLAYLNSRARQVACGHENKDDRTDWDKGEYSDAIGELVDECQYRCYDQDKLRDMRHTADLWLQGFDIKTPEDINLFA